MKLYKKDACDLNEVKKLFAFALEKMVRSYGTKYSRMDQVKFSKGCLPQILLDPFLNI